MVGSARCGRVTNHVQGKREGAWLVRQHPCRHVRSADVGSATFSRIAFERSLHTPQEETISGTLQGFGCQKMILYKHLPADAN
jgi:hypothetical protein